MTCVERSIPQGQHGVPGGLGLPAIALDDPRWQRIVASLPPLIRARAINNSRTRRFLEAVVWIAVTQQPWGRLETHCGAWHSIYVRFTRWAQDGIWDQVIASLQAYPDMALPLQQLVEAYRASRPYRRTASPAARERVGAAPLELAAMG